MGARGLLVKQFAPCRSGPCAARRCHSIRHANPHSQRLAPLLRGAVAASLWTRRVGGL
ncbi:hypothetical protein FTUN_5165 [Frigoriglobus tundricola]|uniref:Uncharacterized protein n=1 Tax=Frigoriglobus tundricola TaxID=2774151 RepID=A0A6M5YVQ0_9BACT|nr:hypothetical protein FTUN_5165 [Frigoriglobus tundricola]